jgi:glycosyltransferase involved in cell wall biosynthesis
MKKILFLLPHRWYIENYIEYVIRYLGGFYSIDMALPKEDYHKLALSNYDTLFIDNPAQHFDYYFLKDPDKYDLIVSLLSTHIHIDGEKYKHKMAKIVYEPAEGRFEQSIMVGATSPEVEKYMARISHPYVPIRFGIDTELFKPYSVVRENSLLQVGFVGKPHNPRRMFKDIVMPLLDINGVEFKFYLQGILNRNDIEYCGGKAFMDRIVSGEQQWTGMPNIYNNIDVLIRMDADNAISFPVLEAAACGVPSITMDAGIDSLITEVGGGILIKADEEDKRSWYYSHPKELVEKYRKAIISLRDDRGTLKLMGENARHEIISNWDWESVMPSWEEFINKSLDKI